jgi:chemotaxis protein methyltransferase CheR
VSNSIPPCNQFCFQLQGYYFWYGARNGFLQLWGISVAKVRNFICNFVHFYYAINMIKAIDLDENVLTKARRGLYDNRSVKDVPTTYLNKYFTNPRRGVYQIKPQVSALVVFEHLNLMDSRALRYEDNYDFVFCRNVLIYFNDVSRKKVVEKFYAMLNKGGYIFLGHSESLSRISTAFKIKRLGGHIVYQT